jgi:hypothetical protein
MSKAIIGTGIRRLPERSRGARSSRKVLQFPVYFKYVGINGSDFQNNTSLRSELIRCDA